MSDQDIRWLQRFSNYEKALRKLEEAAKRIKDDYEIDEEGNIDEDDFLDDIIKEGVIQRFEYTHELAWNVMKDYLNEVGGIKTLGSKDSTRQALAGELITNGEVWMEMIQSRNQTSHTYNEEVADGIFGKIIREYLLAFIAFRNTIEGLLSGKQGNLFDKK